MAGTPSLSINIDVAAIMDAHKALASQLDGKLKLAAQQLAAQAHAHVLELAQQKLHARRQMFVEKLRFEQIDETTWAITVPQETRWIEDGMGAHSMLDTLLGSKKAKVAKDGSRYMVIPFKQNKAPSTQTPTQTKLVDAIKKVLKENKVPYGGIERNSDGSPKTGLLHKFDIDKPEQQNRPQAGHLGPAGQAFQAHPPLPGHEGPGGRPFLSGVRIYQRPQTHPDGSPKMEKSGHQAVSREIMTFRVVSSKQQGQWQHPGLAPMHFLDQTHDWAMQLWETEILPDLLKGLDL